MSFSHKEINIIYAVTNTSYKNSNVVIIEEMTFLVIELLTYGTTCRLVQQSFIIIIIIIDIFKVA